MNSAFVDTSYLLALELRHDQDHQAAIQHWQRRATRLMQMVTTSFILDEVVTFFNNRGYHDRAVKVGNNLLESPSVRFIHVDKSLFYDGWRYFQQHRDKDYSLTDCISFVVMQQLGITTAFTFDHHFRQAGFITEP
jgi:predicted nucleic acid-binding protein